MGREVIEEGGAAGDLPQAGISSGGGLAGMGGESVFFEIGEAVAIRV